MNTMVQYLKGVKIIPTTSSFGRLIEKVFPKIFPRERRKLHIYLQKKLKYQQE